MKLLGRIAIILLAALAVSGLTYELGQTGVLAAVVDAGRGEGRREGATGGANQSAAGNTGAARQGQPPAGFERGGGDQGGFSLFSAVELGKAFAITAVVVVVVAPVASLFQRHKRTQRKTFVSKGNAST